MVIRQAQLTDLDRLLELDRLFWRERQEMMQPGYRHTEAPMAAELMRERISGQGFRTYVATSQGEVVGYLVARVQDVVLSDGESERDGRICDLFVLPQYRRRGIASDLYAAASQWFCHEQCQSEGLTVYPNNLALALYENWGFSPFSINMRKRRDTRGSSGTSAY